MYLPPPLLLCTPVIISKGCVLKGRWRGINCTNHLHNQSVFRAPEKKLIGLDPPKSTTFYPSSNHKLDLEWLQYPLTRLDHDVDEAGQRTKQQKSSNFSPSRDNLSFLRSNLTPLLIKKARCRKKNR